jgi:hypothetical protein
MLKTQDKLELIEMIEAVINKALKTQEITNNQKDMVDFAMKQVAGRRVKWTEFEEDLLMRKFDEMVLDMCVKTGRGQISVQYKVAHLLKARAVRVF